MIAIFTDFGVQGPYLGQMKAVLYRDAPAVPVVDIFPDLPPVNVKAASYLLPAYSQYLPENTVCLCVVDPGVGSERKAVIVHTQSRWYVGPDNGLFAILNSRNSESRCWEITWKPEHLSASFHGRDWFAPVAAKLALAKSFGKRAVRSGELLTPKWPSELLEVVYIDQYGNAITGCRADALDRSSIFILNGHDVCWARTFCDAAPGAAFWYENSNGLVEFAVNQGRADSTLGLSIGDEVVATNPA